MRHQWVSDTPVVTRRADGRPVNCEAREQEFQQQQQRQQQRQEQEPELRVVRDGATGKPKNQGRGGRPVREVHLPAAGTGQPMPRESTSR